MKSCSSAVVRLQVGWTTNIMRVRHAHISQPAKDFHPHEVLISFRRKVGLSASRFQVRACSRSRVCKRTRAAQRMGTRSRINRSQAQICATSTLATRCRSAMSLCPLPSGPAAPRFPDTMHEVELPFTTMRGSRRVT